MKIGRVEAHYIDNVPIEPPPFRKLPNVERDILVEIETSDGIVGWSMAGHAYPVLVDVIRLYVEPLLVGENPFLTERVSMKLHKQLNEGALGRMFATIVSAVDIALWDIKGKALGLPVHHLLGGATETIPVYVTHGAAYGNAETYSIEELAAEAAHLVKLGNRHLKNVVGRQLTPDPHDDFLRMKAIRDAVGPEIQLAMDASKLLSVAQAAKLCSQVEELDIAFFEEPVYENDPRLLSELRSRTTVPIAAAETPKFSARDLLTANAVDIMQPNVKNDGGFTAGVKIAAMAKEFNVPLGHGNGGGPHNIALQAGISNGAIVEYHFHKWMFYNAIYQSVPQPEDGLLRVSQEPGLGLDPKPGLIAEYKVRSDKPVRLIPAQRPERFTIEENAA